MSDSVATPDDKQLTDMSVPDLVRQAYGQITTLVRDELALARAELAEKGNRAGRRRPVRDGRTSRWFWAGQPHRRSDPRPHLGLAGVVGRAVSRITDPSCRRRGGAPRRHKITFATPPYPAEAVRGIGEDVETVRLAVQERSRP